MSSVWALRPPTAAPIRVATLLLKPASGSTGLHTPRCRKNSKTTVISHHFQAAHPTTSVFPASSREHAPDPLLKCFRPGCCLFRRAPCTQEGTFRLPFQTGFTTLSVQSLFVAMAWLQLWLQAVSLHIQSWVRMSGAASSSARAGDICGAQEDDGLPLHLIPLSRHLAKLLRYGPPQAGLYQDRDGWSFFEDVLRFADRWTKEEVEIVLALSANHRGRRFECDFDSGGQPKVRATQREKWAPPPRRRPTPPPARRQDPQSRPAVLSWVPAGTGSAAGAFEDIAALPRSRSPAQEGADAAPIAALPRSRSPATPEESETRRATSSQWRSWRAMQEDYGVAWVCENDTSARFRENSPGPWVLYQDPENRDPENRMRQYWHNADTEEWFFRS